MNTAGHSIVGGWLHIQSTSLRPFSVAAKAIEAKNTRVDVRAWSICSVAVPASDIAKQRHEGTIPVDSVAAANLIVVSGTSKVAVGIVSDQYRAIIATPAFFYRLARSIRPAIVLTLSVLCPSKNISSSRTLRDALLIRVERAAVYVSLKLPTRVVFFETACISVDSLLSDRVQRCCLFRDRIAGELNQLLAECRIVEIHGPLSCPIVGIDVDLALGNRTIKRSGGILSGIYKAAFGKIDIVVATNNTPRNTEGRFADRYRDGGCVCSAVVGKP